MTSKETIELFLSQWNKHMDDNENMMFNMLPGGEHVAIRYDYMHPFIEALKILTKPPEDLEKEFKVKFEKEFVRAIDNFLVDFKSVNYFDMKRRLEELEKYRLKEMEKFVKQ